MSNLEVTVDGDAAAVRSCLWRPCVVDGISQVAAGRCTDRLTRTEAGWHYALKQVRFFYWAELRGGWDAARFTFPAARGDAVPSGGPA